MVKSKSGDRRRYRSLNVGEKIIRPTLTSDRIYEPTGDTRPRQCGTMTTSFYIGQRVSYGGDLCTIRYIGEVKGVKGEWLGVEWDDPSRGKHSGEVDGVRYFTCMACRKEKNVVSKAEF